MGRRRCVQPDRLGLVDEASSAAGILSAMSETVTAMTPVGNVAKTTRRVGVALTMSTAVAVLMLTTWRSSPSSLFLRTIILGLSATAAFALFEVWPRRLPR
jgi:hypothetical protein